MEVKLNHSSMCRAQLRFNEVLVFSSISQAASSDIMVGREWGGVAAVAAAQSTASVQCAVGPGLSPGELHTSAID